MTELSEYLFSFATPVYWYCWAKRVFEALQAPPLLSPEHPSKIRNEAFPSGSMLITDYIFEKGNYFPQLLFRKVMAYPHLTGSFEDFGF